jgi:hypothetical protein
VLPARVFIASRWLQLQQTTVAIARCSPCETVRRVFAVYRQAARADKVSVNAGTSRAPDGVLWLVCVGPDFDLGKMDSEEQ